MIEINKENNTLTLSFEKDGEFNENLLADVADNIKNLNQKNLNIICNGFIPIELCLYLGEISKHCEMTIKFNDDTQGRNFLEFIAKKDMLTICFKD